MDRHSLEHAPRLLHFYWLQGGEGGAGGQGTAESVRLSRLACTSSLKEGVVYCYLSLRAGWVGGGTVRVTHFGFPASIGRSRRRGSVMAPTPPWGGALGAGHRQGRAFWATFLSSSLGIGEQGSAFGFGDQFRGSLSGAGWRLQARRAGCWCTAAGALWARAAYRPSGPATG